MPIINNFCITHKYFNFLENLNTKIIIGGSELRDLSKIPNTWIKDNTGENISYKNKHFGTLTSHYWVWKNQFNKFNEDDWIGFSHYRRHWIKKNNQTDININNLNSNLLKVIPEETNFDVLLTKKIELKNLKFSKFIKKGFNNYIRNPFILLNRKKYSIRLHFDLFHAYGILERSANFLDNEDRQDFKDYINKQNSFHQFEMFISKKKYIELLYKKTFSWIFRCEKEFTNVNLEGYGRERLYNFLAERFLSFYFEKYTKTKTWPHIFLDREIKN
jgi:hypothetical protein